MAANVDALSVIPLAVWMDPIRLSIKLLKAFSFQLVKCVRRDDTVARLGGDQFVGHTDLMRGYLLTR